MLLQHRIFSLTQNDIDIKNAVKDLGGLYRIVRRFYGNIFVVFLNLDNFLLKKFNIAVLAIKKYLKQKYYLVLAILGVSSSQSNITLKTKKKMLY